jgi:hypothetical protein
MLSHLLLQLVHCPEQALRLETQASGPILHCHRHMHTMVTVTVTVTAMVINIKAVLRNGRRFWVSTPSWKPHYTVTRETETVVLDEIRILSRLVAIRIVRISGAIQHQYLGNVQMAMRLSGERSLITRGCTNHPGLLWRREEEVVRRARITVWGLMILYNEWAYSS